MTLTQTGYVYAMIEHSKHCFKSRNNRSNTVSAALVVLYLKQCPCERYFTGSQIKSSSSLTDLSWTPFLLPTTQLKHGSRKSHLTPNQNRKFKPQQVVYSTLHLEWSLVRRKSALFSQGEIWLERRLGSLKKVLLNKRRDMSDLEDCDWERQKDNDRQLQCVRRGGCGSPPVSVQFILPRL